MNTRTNLFALADDYALSFVTGKLYDSETDGFSNDDFIHEMKTKCGVKSHIRLWYWSRVYKGLVDFYTIQIIKLMGKDPKDFKK